MTRNPKLVLTAALILLPVHLCLGQSPSSPSSSEPASPASFEELRAALFKSSPGLQAGQERIRQAEARLAGSRLMPNPSLSYERSTDILFGHDGEGGHSVSFTLPLELGGKREKRSRVAEVDIEIARAELRELERQLTGRLRLLYARAIAAAARRRVVERLVEENQGLESVMDVRVRSGDASRLESALLGAETRRLKLQALRTSGEETSRLTELRGLTGLAPDMRLALASQPELRAGAGVADLESAVALGLRLRPDHQAARLREESAERSIILARAGRIPNLNPFLGYNRQTDVLEGIMIGPFPFVDKSNELLFGVSLDLPVFSRGQAQIAEAASARLQAHAEMEALQREIRMEISAALQRVASSEAAVNLATTELLSDQQESVRILQLSYELGNSGLADVLTQRRLLIETELTVIDLREELWLATAELETALGR